MHSVDHNTKQNKTKQNQNHEYEKGICKKEREVGKEGKKRDHGVRII